ncbi:TetR/AcrR family transcriptional regulator [Acidothermaceae bacterium B102]|nr:TetR/AcrR family transcriptional regulator [Acidothermaceae bacterium B102]
MLPVPPSGQPTRRRNPDAARAVLTAAIELLDNHRVGYRGLTMQSVAERAGVSKATLYRWWPDKAHLVLDAYRSKTARDITGTVTGDVAADLKAHLGHLAFALHHDSARTVSEITQAAAVDPEFGRLYRETLLAERRQAILDILLAGRKQGTVRADADLTVVVDMAFGALHHRLLLTKAPIDGPFVVALTDLIVASTRAQVPARS